MILFCQFDTAGSDIVLDTVDYFSGSLADSAAAVAVRSTDSIRVFYTRADTVFLRRLTFAPTSMTAPDAWSAASTVNSANVSAHHPGCERIGNWLWVAYSQSWVHNDSTYWEIVRTSCCDTLPTVTWEEGTGAVSDVNTYPKDFPSLSTANAVAWAESSGTHWVVRANVDDSLLTLTDGDTNCKFVSICADTAVQTSPSTSTTGIYYLWLQQYSGDTWQVPYAAKQVSTSNADANVTMYNQGRKLALDGNDTLHVVYRTSHRGLYYAKRRTASKAGLHLCCAAPATCRRFLPTT